MPNDDIDMASFLQLPASLAVGQETSQNAQGSLPSQNRLPSALPALPDPTMLFQMSSSLVKIREEILQGMSNIESLREAVKAAGPGEYLHEFVCVMLIDQMLCPSHHSTKAFFCRFPAHLSLRIDTAQFPKRAQRIFQTLFVHWNALYRQMTMRRNSLSRRS